MIAVIFVYVFLKIILLICEYRCEPMNPCLMISILCSANSFFFATNKFLAMCLKL